MDKLIALKTVITRVYLDLYRDGRKEILVPLGNTLIKPLVQFNEAYINFVTKIAEDSAVYDRWLNIQIQVYTELMDDQDAINQFVSCFKNVLKGTPGGEAAAILDESFQDSSFIVALAFRVYLDALVLAGDVVITPEPEEKK